MCASPVRPTWDLFADEVLPHVALPTLHARLQLVGFGLPPDRIEHWVRQFNGVNDDLELRFADEPGDWTDEEMDGFWYDRMKATSLECLDEIRGAHHVP